MINKSMKLSQYAKLHSVSYQTAWNHFNNGYIKGAYKLPSGTIVIPDDPINEDQKTVVYARVSSTQNKDNLDTQANRVVTFCNARGWTVDKIVKECGSGVNDKRPKLLSILKDPTVGRIVVEHKDRLTRFGFNYISTLFHGELVVVNQAGEDEADIIEDFTSIITSFCARIYGNRRSKRKSEKIIQELSNDD